MSHDTHGQSTENKTIISFKNAFWLVVIIVGLFVAALNFIQVESAGEGEGHHGGGHETHEMHAAPHHEEAKAEGKHEEAAHGEAAHEAAAPAEEAAHKSEH